jgi:stearoyl-CoA desaturase (delta-9 desaturase)
MQNFFTLGTLSFWGVHLLCIAAFFLPFHVSDLALCIGLYYLRMFFITGGYHRYFSHRTYQTSRLFQFFIAFMAMTSSQKGVLWWGSHHRHHHQFSDQENDSHTPKKGFWWSHAGWFLSSEYEKTDLTKIQDFARFPELVWLNQYWAVPAFFYAFTLFAIGGLQAFMWGGVISTVLLWHGTFTINSLSHVWGNRRYNTDDTSRNNFILSLISLGEGWHNNHHRFPGATRNGFYWYEIDVTFYALKALSWFGFIWNLRAVPAAAYNEKLKNAGQQNPVELIG